MFKINTKLNKILSYFTVYSIFFIWISISLIAIAIVVIELAPDHIVSFEPRIGVLIILFSYFISLIVVAILLSSQFAKCVHCEKKIMDKPITLHPKFIDRKNFHGWPSLILNMVIYNKVECMHCGKNFLD